MRIFLAGATGALGRPLTRELARRGHDVDGIARTPEAALALAMLGARVHATDLFDADAVAEAAQDADVVVHAAAAFPPRLHATSAELAHADRLRREGTRVLLEAAQKGGASRFVLHSTAWVGRTREGGPFDETDGAGAGPIVASALDAERLALDAPRLDVAVMRCGWLYGPESKHTRETARALADREMPIVGRDNAPLAFLHADDAATAFADAIERAPAGIYHVVDDEPASMARYLNTLAERLHAPPPARVGAWRARLRLSAEEIDLVARPVLTGHERFTAATGWRPRYPTLDDGLRDVVESWREEGFLMGAGRSTNASPRTPSA